MKEEDLYRPVADFVKRELDCFYVGIKKGNELGTIDVVGLRYVMGDYGGTSEVIGIEVKPEEMTFLKCAGQAHAYSIMADRCYLAIHKRYRRKLTQDQRDVASQLNLGLIEIGAGKRCRVIESSPPQTPIRSHRLSLIYKCGFVECVLCGTLFDHHKGMRSLRERSNITHAIREHKALRFWMMTLHEQRADSRGYVYDRRHLCKDCVQVFAALLKQDGD